MEEEELLEALRCLDAAPEKKERPLYARSENLKTHIRKALVRESMESGVLCSETAFIAVREEKNGKISETLLVPNALPRGWSGVSSSPAMMASYSMPDTCRLAPDTALKKIRNLMRSDRYDEATQHSVKMESMSVDLGAHPFRRRAGKPQDHGTLQRTSARTRTGQNAPLLRQGRGRKAEKRVPQRNKRSPD